MNTVRFFGQPCVFLAADVLLNSLCLVWHYIAGCRDGGVHLFRCC